MRYRVMVAPEALSELQAIRREMKKVIPKAVAKWSEGIRERIRTLATPPERCALAPESFHFQTEIRELFFGRPNRRMYRSLFVVEGRNVVVVHVRHGSRLEWDGSP